MKKIYVGTSGYSYQHWKEIFYPTGLAQTKWLPYFAEHFNTVEINATFYRHFPRTVYEKWYTLTPEDFVFTLKGPKTITREKRLRNAEAEVAQFFEAAEGLKEKLSLILWQIPPSFKNTPETLEDLDNFSSILPTKYHQAIEFRHPSWDTEEVEQLLNDRKVGWVSADSSRFMSVNKVTGGFGYFRFHGPHELYSSSYSEEDLAVWASRIKELTADRDIYCYFNNDFKGFAIKNAPILRRLLQT